MPKRSWTDLSAVPVAAVPPILVESGDYGPGGFHCKWCDWDTAKRGFPGRQAVRGHLKKHVRDRRAWRRPLTVQLHHADGAQTDLSCEHSLTDRQIEWFWAGSAINWIRNHA